ncbi:ubiquitin-like protein Pup [Saccharopolyspora phatthalungensis]|uniref:Prokaryotic ubiquitin-like protein Pup n=1 Tax=Saccharopolyspora phatthalungensis TaxID=664693 RepID=A0A840Q9T1_9PSEU|nr:ubiquitin-like protein Pup [Saccharopolyspora phatthalungensis]MBB5157534.1 ubiquitin-like protein Pup [Saccharopolyspora phatthalungensis]
MRQEKNRRHTRSEEEPPEPTRLGADRRDKLDDAAEALLDEIDDVLEENAAEFVRSYIQKGGE